MDEANVSTALEDVVRLLEKLEALLPGNSTE